MADDVLLPVFERVLVPAAPDDGAGGGPVAFHRGPWSLRSLLSLGRRSVCVLAALMERWNVDCLAVSGVSSSLGRACPFRRVEPARPRLVGLSSIPPLGTSALAVLEPRAWLLMLVLPPMLTLLKLGRCSPGLSWPTWPRDGPTRSDGRAYASDDRRDGASEVGDATRSSWEIIGDGSFDRVEGRGERASRSSASGRGGRSRISSA